MTFLRPTYIISILIAIAVHEWAHAMSARKLGDPTAEIAGRLTLNPISHIDPIGALLFITVGFGWAKPVPVNPSYFRHPKRGMAITALAGPVSNFILAFLSFMGVLLLSGGASGSIMGLLETSTAANPFLTVFQQIFRDSLFVNLALMAFNLFPIAPLDGSNIVQMFVPAHLEDRYHDFVRAGPFLLLGLILLETFLPIQILSGWVFGIMQGVLTLFGAVVGIL